MSLTEDKELDALANEPFDQHSKQIRPWLDNVSNFYRTRIEDRASGVGRG
jgi:hypothetical protein